MTNVSLPKSTDNPALEAKHILCCYHNATGRIQIIRFSNTAPHRLEKVVFPGERFLFNAMPEFKLEVHSNPSTNTTSTVTALLPCSELQVSMS